MCGCVHVRSFVPLARRGLFYSSQAGNFNRTIVFCFSYSVTARLHLITCVFREAVSSVSDGPLVTSSGHAEGAGRDRGGGGAYYLVYPEGDVSEAALLSGKLHQFPVHGPELIKLVCATQQQHSQVKINTNTQTNNTFIAGLHTTLSKW